VDATTHDFLRLPAPLQDEALLVDPFVHARPGQEPGHAVLTTAAGSELAAEFTVPLPGVLRLRLGDRLAPPTPSILLTDRAAGPPATLTALPSGDVAVRGPGLDAVLAGNGSGLRLAALRPAEIGHTLLGPAALWGRTATPAGETGWLVTAALDGDTGVYGGGESFQGPDLRGRHRRLVNVETHGAAGLDLAYLSVPFFWTDAGWGVLAHTGAPVRADLGCTHPGALALAVPGRELDVFFCTGDGPRLVSAYQQLTGLPGSFPRWGLGVWTSRCSYLSAAELRQVVDSYAAADCPVDVVHVDAWQTGDVVADLTCSWEVDEDRFPPGWADWFTDRGVRISLWHNPYLRIGTAVGDEADERGLLLRDGAGRLLGTNDMPERAVLDFTAPGAAQWWSDHVAALLKATGATTLKADFAEEVPPEACAVDGRTGWEVRNEYAVAYQQATHDALVAATGEAQPMFCRSGSAGSQRYPCHWVGDTPSTWSGLESALRACLSLSLTGFGLVASDVGGFWADGAFERTVAAMQAMDPAPFTADVDPELFLRWTQWGAMSPVLRFHGTGRREPWAYPAPYGPLAVQACRLRARLGGYLAAAAAQAATVGTPMMRPMVLAFPGDRAAAAAPLQYLLGPDILVAPMLRPGSSLDVWAPPGAWRPLAGAPALEGPGWQAVEVPLEALPVWVRPEAPWPLTGADR